MFGIGYMEMIILGAVAVLLFGGRLPEVARNLGSSYREFRKGLMDLRFSIDVDSHSDYSDLHRPRLTQHTEQLPNDLDEPTAPQFELPPASPTESSN